MSEIINSKKFDEIYDKIVWIENLDKELNIFKEPLKNFVKNKFLCENTFKIYYENQEYHILTDAYYKNQKSDKYL
jgi:hypothetical protein